MHFNRLEFISDPSYCQPLITYTYDCPGSTATDDWCLDGATSSDWDDTVENLSFSTVDKLTWPPGVYTGKMTGTLGDKSTFTEFTLTLIWPFTEPT